MEAPSEDFAVVPDNGAQQHAGSTSGFPPLRDQQFTPKMFAYDGENALPAWCSPGCQLWH